MVAVSVRHLDKTFDKGKMALKNVNLELKSGEMVALIGASGSGKSTLIRHIAGLITGDKGSGRVDVFGDPIQANGSIAKGARGHRSEIGVIFQQFNLVNRLSVLTNVLMGVLGRAPVWRTWLGIFSKAERQLAMTALGRVGIAEYATRRSSNLSGGQQQRAAIARTIVQGARLILADEPIASLDPAASRKVMDNLARINRDDGVTVLVSLHQVDYAIEYCRRTIAMRNGEVVFDGPSEKLTPAFLHRLYGSQDIGTIINNKKSVEHPGETIAAAASGKTDTDEINVGEIKADAVPAYAAG